MTFQTPPRCIDERGRRVRVGVDALTDAQRQAYEAFATAFDAMAATEAEVAKILNSDTGLLSKAVNKHRHLRDKFNNFFPRLTQVDNARAYIASQRNIA